MRRHPWAAVVASVFGSAAPSGLWYGSFATRDMARLIFDWSQQAADRWRDSNNGEKREILETVGLNRTLSDVSLCLVKRKPFDVLAERAFLKVGRGDWI